MEALSLALISDFLLNLFPVTIISFLTLLKKYMEASYSFLKSYPKSHGLKSAEAAVTNISYIGKLK